MKIYVIIVTHNGVEWIKKCLESLYNCSSNISIIIVDNNSSDKTLKIVNNRKDCILLNQKKNLGFGAANNIGISYAIKNGADYCFLMNQDVYVEPNTIELLIKIHQKNKGYGIMSPLHFNGKGDKLDENFSRYIKNNNNLYLDYQLKNYTSEVYEVAFVNAASWLISKEVFLKIGGFDPIFFHYAEDNNFCQRILFHGFKIGIVPKVSIRHDRGLNQSNRVKIFSKKYYANYEKELKEFYADINVDDIGDIFRIEKRKYLLKLINSLIQLNKYNIYGYYKQYKLIGRTQHIIELSRKKNKNLGSHYLK